MKHVARFNPYLMTDDQVLSLNTGREKELKFSLDIIEKNIQRKNSLQHLLIHGPRGIGKSFFLRLLQIQLFKLPNIKMILLPEEQLNVYQPSDLLRVIKNHLLENDESANIGSWFAESRDAWLKQAKELEDQLNKAQTHLVVGVENFDLLFSKAGAFAKNEHQYMLRECHILLYKQK